MATYDTPRPVRIRLEFGAGSVTIAATDTTVTTVELHAADGDPDGAAAVAATVIEARGDEVLVLVPRRWRARRAPHLVLSMTVPAGSPLHAEVASASLVATGRLGRSDVTSGSGDVTLEQVDGDARIMTGSGDIAVESVRADSHLRAGSGAVRVDDAGGSLRVGTGSGDVRVGHARGDFTGKSGSGDLLLEHAAGSVAMASGSGSLRVERIGGGTLSATTASGQVDVGVAGHTATWLDLQTVTGRVDSALEESAPPAPGEPVLELRAKTVSGNMRVRRV
jgi:DUF4097 and DUF4098 domain-containing protein YvlB